jgi:hypothetical protein
MRRIFICFASLLFVACSTAAPGTTEVVQLNPILDTATAIPTLRIVTAAPSASTTPIPSPTATVTPIPATATEQPTVRPTFKPEGTPIDPSKLTYNVTSRIVWTLNGLIQ